MGDGEDVGGEDVMRWSGGHHGWGGKREMKKGRRHYHLVHDSPHMPESRER